MAKEHNRRTAAEAAVAAATTSTSAAALAVATGPAGAIPPVADQAAAMADTMIATGRPNAAGGAAEDVTGSAREAPGVGSGSVGADVPERIAAERGLFGRIFNPADVPIEVSDWLRALVREEIGRLVDAGELMPSHGAVGDDLRSETLFDEGYDLEITSKVDGFHRGGRAHPSRPVRYRFSDFQPGQLAAIRAEPNLFVRELA